MQAHLQPIEQLFTPTFLMLATLTAVLDCQQSLRSLSLVHAG